MVPRIVGYFGRGVWGVVVDICNGSSGTDVVQRRVVDVGQKANVGHVVIAVTIKRTKVKRYLLDLEGLGTLILDIRFLVQRLKRTSTFNLDCPSGNTSPPTIEESECGEVTSLLGTSSKIRCTHLSLQRMHSCPEMNYLPTNFKYGLNRRDTL